MPKQTDRKGTKNNFDVNIKKKKTWRNVFIFSDWFKFPHVCELLSRKDWPLSVTFARIVLSCEHKLFNKMSKNNLGFCSALHKVVPLKTVNSSHRLLHLIIGVNLSFKFYMMKLKYTLTIGDFRGQLYCHSLKTIFNTFLFHTLSLFFGTNHWTLAVRLLRSYYFSLLPKAHFVHGHEIGVHM